MGYTNEQAKSFINQIAPYIQKYAKLYGYKVCSPIIAQAVCESAANTSSLGFRYHNYFGMKCGPSWKGSSVNLKTKEEYKAGELTSITADFRTYKDMDAGVEGYFTFISSKRYAPLKNCATPQSYLETLKACGYATSSSYVKTNLNIIKKYDLTRFDEKPTVVIAEPTLKIGDKGTNVEALQMNLNSFGASLIIDGKFGEKTEMELIKWQMKHSVGTVYDGVYGPKSYNKMKELLNK